MVGVILGGVIVPTVLVLLYVAYRYWMAKRLSSPVSWAGMPYVVSALSGFGGVIGVVLGSYLDGTVSAALPIGGGVGALAGLVFASLIALFHPRRRLVSRYPLGRMLLIGWSFNLMPILTVVGMGIGAVTA